MPSGAAFRARAVVAVDVDHQRVVQLAHVVHRLDHPADEIVGIGDVGGVDLGLLDEELLLLVRGLVPRLEDVRGPRRQLRVLRHDAELLLVGEDGVAQGVPAIVEEVHVVDLVHPLLGRVVRGMHAARHVIEEERLVRLDLVHAVEVVDRVVRHAGDEVPARLPVEWVDLRGVAEKIRLPLVGVAADEAVEIFKSLSDGPVVEGSDLARLEGRHVVVLAEPGSCVAIVAKDAPDGRLVLGNDAVVAGVARRLLGDDAKAGGMVVAAGDQRRARRRAQRRRMHLRIAQALIGDTVERGRRDDAAEGARHAVARIVRHDQQHVGRALWRHDARRPPGRRLQ